MLEKQVERRLAEIAEIERLLKAGHAASRGYSARCRICVCGVDSCCRTCNAGD